MNETAELLSLLKTKLMITYTESDELLEKIIENAVPDLQEKIGDTSIDFEIAGAEQTFFLNYCKYSFYGQEDTFFDKYRNEFLNLRQKHSIEDETSEEESTDEETTSEEETTESDE